MIIMSCIGIITGGLSAELSLALAGAGIAMTIYDAKISIDGVSYANKLKEQAQTTHEAKDAAKIMADNIAKLTIDVINVICTVAGYLKGKKKIDTDNTVESKIINKTNRNKNEFTAKNKEDLEYLTRYYTDNYIAKEINQNSNKSIDDIISSLLLEQKKNITKPISTGRTSSFADEFFAELEKQGITKERIETLRNLDYTKMTKKDFARIKPEIEEIINLTKSYDLAKTNPEGYMVKFMPAEYINKYLNGTYKGITGFIAREEDVIQLQTFEDIFYSMRLDYTNNKFVYDNEIAFIKFKSSDYTETTVPIGKNYGVGQTEDETELQIIDASANGTTWQNNRNQNEKQLKKAKANSVNQTWAPFSTLHTPDLQAYLDFSKFNKEIEIK